MRKIKLTPFQKKSKIQQITNEINEEWVIFRREVKIMHGIEIKDDPFEALILYLVLKGILTTE
jgi:hypothetical protein